MRLCAGYVAIESVHDMLRLISRPEVRSKIAAARSNRKRHTSLLSRRFRVDDLPSLIGRDDYGSYLPSLAQQFESREFPLFFPLEDFLISLPHEAPFLCSPNVARSFLAPSKESVRELPSF